MERLQIGKVTAVAGENNIEGTLYAIVKDNVFFFKFDIYVSGSTSLSYAVLGPNQEGKVWFTKNNTTYYFDAPLICKSPAVEYNPEKDE